MKRSLLLYIAAGFVFFVTLGHTAGFFMESNVPPEQIHIAQARNVMKAAVRPMPMGVERDLLTLWQGMSLFMSVCLLAGGLTLVFLAKKDSSVNLIIQVQSGAWILAGILSAIFFFPLPAICLVLAGGLGIYASTRPA